MKRPLVYMGPADKIALQLYQMFRVQLARDYRQICAPEDLKSLPLQRTLLMLRMLIFDQRSLNLFIKLNAKIADFGCIILAPEVDSKAIMNAREIPRLCYLNPLKELSHLAQLIYRLEQSGVFSLRAHPRTHTKEAVTLRLRSNKRINATLLNTSRMGARVSVEGEPIPDGSIELILPKENRAASSRIISKVVWLKPHDKGLTMGLFFIAVA